MLASRETVQQSLVFSPFELVFGHHVRGPLTLLSEQWVKRDSDISLLDYVSRFKQRLYEACALAKENLQNSQRQMKTWYDRKARHRIFSVADRVLVLFPFRNNPLQARFCGSYQVHKKICDVN